MFRRLVAIVAGGVLLVGAGGCTQQLVGDGDPSEDALAQASATEGDSGSEPTDDGNSGTSEPTDDGGSDDGSDGGTSDAASCDDFTPSGDPVAYDDGLTVAAGDFAPFTPSPQAAGAGPGTTSFVVTVTWTNAGSAPIALDFMFVEGFAAEVPGSEVFDLGQGVGGSFGLELAPGDCVAEKHAYAFTSPDFSNIRLDVTPGTNYDPATFTAKI